MQLFSRDDGFVERLECPSSKRYKGQALYLSHRERNAHAHKTKRGDEKGGSDAEIEGGWPEGSQAPAAEGCRDESCEYDKAESSSLEGSSDQKTTGCWHGTASCPGRSAACRRSSTAFCDQRVRLGILRAGWCRCSTDCCPCQKPANSRPLQRTRLNAKAPLRRQLDNSARPGLWFRVKRDFRLRSGIAVGHGPNSTQGEPT
jgi:hypothetical protein